MLLESLEGLDVSLTEQKVKTTPPKLISSKPTGRPDKSPEPPKVKSKATSETYSQDDIWKDMERDGENDEIDDSNDEDYDDGEDDDDEDDDDDENAEGVTKKAPFLGMRAPVRKEFMINPRSGFITAKKTSKD